MALQLSARGYLKAEVGGTRSAPEKSDASSPRSPPWDLLFGPWSVAVGSLVLAAAAAGAWWADPDGGAFDLCYFRRFSGLPCPGCGLTRSVVAMAQGDWRLALAFHPFGPLVLGWAIAASGTPLLGGRARRRGALALTHARPGFDRAYGTVLAAFIGFGALRLLGVALGIWPTSWWGALFRP